MGTVDSVKRAVLEAIEDGIDGVVLACSLPLQTPIDNVWAILVTVKDYNKNRGFG